MDEHGDMVHQVSYDTVSESLRPWLASKLKLMFEALEPYVDGSFGEVNPSHAAVAVQVLRQLGGLYRTQDRPAGSDGVPAAQVEAMIAAAVGAARVEWEQAREVASTSARARILGAARNG